MIDPDLMQSRLAEMAGLDEGEDGNRSKRNDLGQFILAPFKQSEPQPEFMKLAHNFFELVCTCVGMSGSKGVEGFIVDFYESQLTRVLSQEAQLLFFQSSTGSHWHAQLAMIMLARRFRMGPGMTTGKTLTPLQMHLALLEDLVKLGKSKFSGKRTLDRLMAVSFLSTAKVFASKELSCFKMDDGSVASWTTDADHNTLKAFLEPNLENPSKDWNPFLFPYRLMFGKPREKIENTASDDIEVVILTSGTDDQAGPSPKRRSQRSK